MWKHAEMPAMRVGRVTASTELESLARVQAEPNSACKLKLQPELHWDVKVSCQTSSTDQDLKNRLIKSTSVILLSANIHHLCTKSANQSFAVPMSLAVRNTVTELLEKVGLPGSIVTQLDATPSARHVLRSSFAVGQLAQVRVPSVFMSQFRSRRQLMTWNCR